MLFFAVNFYPKFQHKNLSIWTRFTAVLNSFLFPIIDKVVSLLILNSKAKNLERNSGIEAFLWYFGRPSFLQLLLPLKTPWDKFFADTSTMKDITMIVNHLATRECPNYHLRVPMEKQIGVAVVVVHPK